MTQLVCIIERPDLDSLSRLPVLQTPRRLWRSMIIQMPAVLGGAGDSLFTIKTFYQVHLL
jgi:hypothetical protein